MPIKIKRNVENTEDGKRKTLNVSIENKKGDKGIHFNRLKDKYSDGSSRKEVNSDVWNKKNHASYVMDKNKDEGSKSKTRNYRVTSAGKKEDVAGGYKNTIKTDREFGNGVSSKKIKVSFDKNQNLSKKKEKSTIRTSEPSKTSSTQVKKTKVNRFGSKVTTTRKGAVPVKQMKKK